MTIDELILQDIDKKPLNKQSNSEKQLYEALKEKEYYRFDAIYQEQRADKWQKAYEKLKKQYEELKKEEKR